MAKYGGDDVVVKVDNSAGTLVDISQYVTEIGGISKEAITEESHTFGDSWVEHLYTGLRRTGDITIGGFYDDTATTGPDAILNSIGDTRTVEFTFGGTKTFSVETVIATYDRTLSRGALHKFSATLRPTGAVTEA